MTSAVESRLEKLTIQHSSVTDILKGFNKDALTSIIATEGPTQDAQGKPFKPSQMRSQIRRQVTIIAARTLAESLSLEELKGALKNLNIDHEKVGNNPNSKRVHIKRFEEQMHEHGIEAFLSEKVDADVQVSFCAALGLKPASTSNAEVLAKQIANYLEYQAITAYFEAFDVHFLHDLAFDNKLEKEVEETSSKAVLIEALFTGNRVATVEAERPKQKTVKSKKQPAKPKAIAQGVTYDALFQHYGVDELREWARENGIIVSGSKPDLINRILAFLDGDKENTTADGREAQRKAKSEEKKAAKAAKEAKAKPATAEKKQRKTVKETKPAPKEEEVEEEEEEEVVEETKPEPTKPAAQPTTTETKDEEEVEDEEEAEGLDLDNLKQYSRADLVKYCEEEEIAFKTGAKKGELIEAILKYNEDQEE